MIAAAVIVATLASPVHDQWADGTSVPGWVKSGCCGAQDVHKLEPSKVWEENGGWRVAGLDSVTPRERTFPSQDGWVWAFYDPLFGKQAVVNCLFIPFGY